jgi:glutathione S-transferase
MRARLAVAVSGQRCELREVVLRDKPQEMLIASPKGTVPVLIVPDGRVIDESLDIMLWALRQHDPESWLTPQQGDREAMVQLIARFDAGFKYHLDRYKYPGRYSAADEVGSQTHRDEGAVYLEKLNAQLAETGWLFGSRAALADMAIFPFVRQFALTGPDWFSAQPWPRLQRWLSDRVGSSLYEGIMAKYPPWKPGDAGVGFPGS